MPEKRTGLPASTPPRGRGAGLNPDNRFHRHTTEPVDDGWIRDDDPTTLETRVSVDASRTVLTRNRSPDVPFDQSVNPYRGCEHGCIYCFARPSHAELGFSAGLDFETELIAKPRAPELLARALARPGYAVAPIAIGTNTDPYQPIERVWQVMRNLLKVLAAHRHPVTITTKGTLVTRDLDILAAMAADGLVQVSVSLTTLENRLSRAMEPRAAAPKRRLAIIRQLAGAGVPVGASIAPVIPGLTDHEMEALMEAGAQAGATSASFIMLRLPREVSPLFRDWLERFYPDRYNKIMGKVREMHGGRDYDSRWGHRLRGEGPVAALIARRFELAARRLGLETSRHALRSDLFRVPPRSGEQLSLFGG